MPRPAHDQGDTLVEVLVALAVLSIAIVALMGALGVNASTTVVNRSQTQTHTALVSAAEWVKSRTMTAAEFSACAPASGSPAIALPSGYTATYGPGMQLESGTPCSVLVKVPVTVTSDDGFVMRLDVLRRP